MSGPIRLNTELLEERIKQAGLLTHADVATYTGITRTTITRLLQGKYPPGLGSLAKLRDAFEFGTIEDLLIGVERPNVPAQAGAPE